MYRIQGGRVIEENIKVYVRIDNNNVVIQVDSSIFLFEVEGWIKVDEGQVDKYSHAQGNYLDKPLMDIQGKYNYQLVDDKVIELTKEEKERLFPTQAPQPTQEEILRAKIIKDGITMQLQIASLTTQIAQLIGGTK